MSVNPFLIAADLQALQIENALRTVYSSIVNSQNAHFDEIADMAGVSGDAEAFNAIAHAAASAYIELHAAQAISQAFGDSVAELLGDLKELPSGAGQELDSTKDQMNNAVGREIAREILKAGGTEDDIKAAVAKAFEEGRLHVIKDGRITSSNDGQAFSPAAAKTLDNVAINNGDVNGGGTGGDNGPSGNPGESSATGSEGTPGSDVWLGPLEEPVSGWGDLLGDFVSDQPASDSALESASLLEGDFAFDIDFQFLIGGEMETHSDLEHDGISALLAQFEASGLMGLDHVGDLATADDHGHASTADDHGHSGMDSGWDGGFGHGGADGPSDFGYDRSDRYDRGSLSTPRGGADRGFDSNWSESGGSDRDRR